MKGAARRPSCSQNAHDKNVLAWVRGASWRAQGGRVRKFRAVKDSLGSPLRRGLEKEQGLTDGAMGDQTECPANLDQELRLCNHPHAMAKSPRETMYCEPLSKTASIIVMVFLLS